MQRQSGKNIESLQMISVYACDREGDRERGTVNKTFQTMLACI